MCTVVARWRQQDQDQVPVQVLALRDEFAGRDFDLPGQWWPDQPGVIGGRDRRGGGSWCVSDVGRGVTAVVLNRPERRDAADGAASRGVLPLLAVRYGERWVEHVDATPMASFNLVLLSPDSLLWWRFDGDVLEREELGEGTHVFKPTGRAGELPDVRLGVGAVGAEIDARAFQDPTVSTEQLWSGWFDAVVEAEPREDGTGLLMLRTVDEKSYETVFSQFIAAQPGALRLDYLTHPARGTDGAWTTQLRRQPAGSSHGSPGARSWVS